MQRDALVSVATHARQDLRRKTLGVIARLHNPLEGVAAHAIKQRQFLLRRAWHAHDPLAVAELTADVLGLDELDVGGRGLVARQFDRARAGELIADGPDREGIFAGAELGSREAELAAGVADHRDGAGPAFPTGADHTALR